VPDVELRGRLVARLTGEVAAAYDGFYARWVDSGFTRWGPRRALTPPDPQLKGACYP
jgi:hypothetical protein